MSDQYEEVNMGSTVWQSQQVEAPRISLEFIHHHSERKGRSLRGERDMFYLVTAGAFVYGCISVFKHGFVVDTPMDIVFGVFVSLFSFAMVYMGFYVHRHVRMKKLSVDADVVGGLAVYRSELERLLQLAHREWHVLLYVAPSYFALLIGGLIFDQRPGKTGRYASLIVAGVLSVTFALWVGRKKSRCLRRELDAIASLK